MRRIERATTTEEVEEGMRNSIRCCISCILPCGALDVIRIVHSNGRVEELTGTIKASDIMKAHPKHVLKKPSSSSSQDGVVPKIVVVPPDAELRRGKIYFLMPLPSPPSDKNHRHKSSTKKKRKDHHHSQRNNNNNSISISNNNNNSDAISVANMLVSNERYLTDILSEKLSTQRERRRGRVAVWRPHLESISESPPTDM